MRLSRLEIDNFRVIRRARLSFPDRVIGIIGANGAGKSSVVEAVAWALYGQRVARSAKEEIRSIYAPRDEGCRVALDFEIRGEPYRLVRQLVGRQERPEVTLARNGKPESTGTVETERHVVELLGLDWRGFLTSFLARQQELNALADLTPGKRRDQLAGMLGVDQLDRALKRMKDDRKAQGDKIGFLERQLIRREDLARELASLREHMVELRKKEAESSGAYKKAKADYGRIEKEYREHQARQASCSQLEARLTAGRDTAVHLREQQASLSARLKDLDRAGEQAAALAEQLKGFDQLRDEFKRLTEAREIAARRQDWQGRLTAIGKERTETQKEIAERRKDGESLAAELNRLPSDLEARLGDTGRKLETARQQYTELRAEVRAAEQSLDRVTGQLTSISDLGPEAVCDRCHRPFGDDLPQIREHLGSEKEKVEAEVGRLKADLEKVRSEGERLKTSKDELTESAAKRRELTVRHEGIEKEVGRLEARAKELEKEATELTGRIEKLGTAEFSAERMRKVEEEIARLEKLRAERDRLEGDLKNRPEVAESLAKTGEKLTRLETELGKLQEEIDRLGFDPKAFKRATETYESAAQELERVREAKVRTERDLELAGQEEKLKSEELDRLAKAGEELDTVREEKYYLEKLVNLFTDFRKYTISRIRPRLSELAGQLFSEMSGGRYSLVELDDEYNLQIMDGGQFYGIERFSGGEKDLASLCLRLAISLALTESAGLERSFVILDEVFGSQDAGRRELIFEALANLKHRFPQVLLITHLDELKNKVETLIELEPQPGGWSEVKVNGQTA